MKFVNTWDYHRNRPEEKPQDYYRALRVELSKSIENQKIVYLDTNFWVRLRKGMLAPDKHKNEKAFLDVTLNLAERGTCVFPISENTFWEVMGQSDEKTLRATAELIDKLSRGITSISSQERTQLELMHFWYSFQGKDLYKLPELVWSKLAYSTGLFNPSIPELEKEQDEMLQKVFIDQMWNVSLTEMLDGMLSDGKFTTPPKSKIADKLNQGKFAHQDEARSFKEMFLNEIGGVIDLLGEDLADMMENMFKKDHGKKLSIADKRTHRAETMRLMRNAIYNLFKLNKMPSNALPTLRILASLHAAVRWDKKQKFDDHDMHDFGHATTALPYADYFFTEKRLHHLMQQKLLGLDKLYKCEIHSKLVEATRVLQQLKV